jgi:hypothetical protein
MCVILYLSSSNLNVGLEKLAVISFFVLTGQLNKPIVTGLRYGSCPMTDNMP